MELFCPSILNFDWSNSVRWEVAWDIPDSFEVPTDDIFDDTRLIRVEFAWENIIDLAAIDWTLDVLTELKSLIFIYLNIIKFRVFFEF